MPNFKRRSASGAPTSKVKRSTGSCKPNAKPPKRRNANNATSSGSSGSARPRSSDGKRRRRGPRRRTRCGRGWRRPSGAGRRSRQKKGTRRRNGDGPRNTMSTVVRTGTTTGMTAVAVVVVNLVVDRNRGPLRPADVAPTTVPAPGPLLDADEATAEAGAEAHPSVSVPEAVATPPSHPGIATEALLPAVVGSTPRRLLGQPGELPLRGRRLLRPAGPRVRSPRRLGSERSGRSRGRGRRTVRDGAGRGQGRGPCR